VQRQAFRLERRNVCLTTVPLPAALTRQRREDDEGLAKIPSNRGKMKAA
jgi:hypothetical protein